MTKEQFSSLKLDWLVRFDNLVTNEVIIKTYQHMTYDEVYKDAFKYSRSIGLSEGNFDICLTDYRMFLADLI